MPNIFGDIADFFSGLIGGGADLIAQGASGLPKAVESFFQHIGGQIAAGFEAGAISVLKDIWDVVLGPLEIIVGILFILFALFIAFRSQLFQAAKLFGMMGLP